MRGSDDASAKLKAKEIANGRLAMVAFAGILVQYDHTGVGPVANLMAHMADPAPLRSRPAKFVSLVGTARGDRRCALRAGLGGDSSRLAHRCL